MIFVHKCHTTLHMYIHLISFCKHIRFHWEIVFFYVNFSLPPSISNMHKINFALNEKFYSSYSQFILLKIGIEFAIVILPNLPQHFYNVFFLSFHSNVSLRHFIVGHWICVVKFHSNLLAFKIPNHKIEISFPFFLLLLILSCVWKTFSPWKSYLMGWNGNEKEEILIKLKETINHFAGSNFWGVIYNFQQHSYFKYIINYGINENKGVIK